MQIKLTLHFLLVQQNETMIGLIKEKDINYIVNSNPYVELIGVTIRADCFGYVCSGNPYQTAILAYKDACISYKRNGIYGEMFMTATIATSFSTTNAKIGINYISNNSR